jgi:hypothetical protein
MTILVPVECVVGEDWWDGWESTLVFKRARETELNQGKVGLGQNKSPNRSGASAGSNSANESLRVASQFEVK